MRVIYQAWKPGEKRCVAWMPWNWHHNRRPRGRYNRR
jgi:hypothetical protein